MWDEIYFTEQFHTKLNGITTLWLSWLANYLLNWQTSRVTHCAIDTGSKVSCRWLPHICLPKQGPMGGTRSGDASPPPTLFWCRVVGSVYDPFYKFPKPALTPISHWAWWEEQVIDLFFSSLFSFLTKLFLSLFMWATKCNTMKAFQERLTFIPMFKQLAFHSALQCVKTTCGTNHFLSSVIRPWR